MKAKRGRPIGSKTAGTTKEVSPVRGSGMKIVYNQLRREIIELELAPGAQLDETSLSARFSMSRPPVREALVRLAAEGLVDTLPNRNTIVSHINFEQMPTYFDALTLMYRVTTRLGAQHRTPEDLDVIRQLWPSAR